MNSYSENSITPSGVLEGYIHKPGDHCFTSALRDVFEFHGFNMSEEMLFGLGSGLGLGYINMRGFPDPILGGRSESPDGVACKRLGIQVNKFKTNDPEKGWLRLKERLDQGIPSMIVIDMAYLPYHGLPEDFHFGQHAIVVCGYNPEKNVVYVSDTSFEDIKEVTLEDLKKGRSSSVNKFMDPYNMIYEYNFPVKLNDLDQIIPEALRQAGKNILESPRLKNMLGITSGLKSITKFSKDLLKWVKLPIDKLSYRCFMLAGYISEFGTGGGSFRYLYSRFLKESYEINNDPSLIDLSTSYSNIGDKWEDVAGFFREVQKANMNPQELTTHFQSVISILSEIKELENQNAQLLVNYT